MDVEYLNGRKLFVIPQFLTPEECAAFVERSEQFGYADAPINTSFGPLLRKDVRDNQRILVDDPELATAWWDRGRGLLVEDWFGWRAAGLNERFRFYRYDPGQRFARHTDGCFRRDNGEQSWFTFLVYLNDGFGGGSDRVPRGPGLPAGDAGAGQGPGLLPPAGPRGHAGRARPQVRPADGRHVPSGGALRSPPLRRVERACGGSRIRLAGPVC